MVIRVGARASKLAQIQAASVVEWLRHANPRQNFAIVTVSTQGDADQDRSLKELGGVGVGVFVKELEASLLRGEIDLAVHSAKDLPSALPEDFFLAAVPHRDAVEDALISASGQTLKQLPAGAKLATGSPRRRALILSLRPDLNLVDIRGNVDTRLRKLHEGQFDALVLARAGLMRMGLEDEIAEILPPEVFVPAAGQGALAVESRSNDSLAIQIAAKINAARDHACLMAERRLLDELKAGCSIPVGAWARWEAGQLAMDAIILDPEGRSVVRASGWVGRLEEAGKLGENLARELIDKGAGELLGIGN